MYDLPLVLIVIIAVVGLLACALALAGKSFDEDTREDPWPDEEWTDGTKFVDDDR